MNNECKGTYQVFELYALNVMSYIANNRRIKTLENKIFLINTCKLNIGNISIFQLIFTYGVSMRV